jgi:peptidoglycan/LPS O-acetylase OafA/YrhL
MPGPIEMFVLTMLATAPLALASWHLVEKPALSLKRRFGRPGVVAAPGTSP